MNRVTLERLLKETYDSVVKASTAKEKLDKFCEKNWGFTYNDIEHVLGQDELVESLDYARSLVSVDSFIQIMDKEQYAIRQGKETLPAS